MQKEASTLGQQEMAAQEEETAKEETIPEIVPTDQDEITPDIAPSHTSPTSVPMVSCT